MKCCFGLPDKDDLFEFSTLKFSSGIELILMASTGPVTYTKSLTYTEKVPVSGYQVCTFTVPPAGAIVTVRRILIC